MPLEDDIGEYLIGDHHEIVTQRHLGKRLEFLPPDYAPGGIVRIVDKNEPGFGSDAVQHARQVGLQAL